MPKRMYKWILWCTIPLLATQIAFAEGDETSESQALTDEKAVKRLAEKMITQIVQDQPNAAINAVAPHFPASPRARTQLTNQVQQSRTLLEQRFGSSLGYELVDTSRADDFLLRYTFLEKRPRNVTRWTLTFYKPRDQWLFHTLGWDEQIAHLFQ